MFTIKRRRLIETQKGFTLIEMAIVIMIVGLMIASLVPLYDIYKKKQEIQTTKDNIAIATSAIGAFRSMNGRYPCPADLGAMRGDMNYGREDADCVAQTGDQKTLGAGNCTLIDGKEGLCIEQKAGPGTNANFKYPATAAVASNPVRILVGSLPFRVLNVDERGAYDGYGNHILYVVTQHLTCADCFQPDQGGISIVDQTGTSAITPDSSAHFLVLSSGQNGVGAYTPSGIRTFCTGVDPSPEHENCDFKENAAQANATYAISETNSRNNGPNYYDDTISYFTQDEMPLWQYSTSAANPNAINNKNADNVGLGQSNSITEKGKVSGSVRAADDTIKTPLPAGPIEGKIQSPVFCDGDDTTCMESRLIAGDSSIAGEGIKCADPNEFMQGIRNGQAICNTLLELKCGPGQLMRGLKANGEPDCGAPPPKDCDAITVDLCPPGVAASLPAGVNGQVSTAHAGSDRAQDFICNDGAWSALNMPYGNCTCTPDEVTTNGIQCESGFQGTYTTTTKTTCTPATTVTVTNTSTSDCSCVDQIVPDDLNCPYGYTDNNYQQTRRHVCAGGAHWENPVVTGTCTCDPHPDDVQSGIPCGNGLDGTKSQKRVWDTSSCQFGLWQDTDTHLCHCEEKTYPGQAACPVGADGTIYDGTIEIKLEIKCIGGVPTPSPSGWVPTGVRNCTPQQPRRCTWQPQDAGIVQNGSSGPGAGDSCDAQCGQTSRYGCNRAVGTQYRNYTTCICN